MNDSKEEAKEKKDGKKKEEKKELQVKMLPDKEKERLISKLNFMIRQDERRKPYRRIDGTMVDLQCYQEEIAKLKAYLLDHNAL